jgi:hypothetical protein
MDGTRQPAAENRPDAREHRRAAAGGSGSGFGSWPGLGPDPSPGAAGKRQGDLGASTP